MNVFHLLYQNLGFFLNNNAYFWKMASLLFWDAIL